MNIFMNYDIFCVESVLGLIIITITCLRHSYVSRDECIVNIILTTDHSSLLHGEIAITKIR